VSFTGVSAGLLTSFHCVFAINNDNTATMTVAIARDHSVNLVNTDSVLSVHETHWSASPPIGCNHPYSPSSSFIITTQLKGDIHLSPKENRRLS